MKNGKEFLMGAILLNTISLMLLAKNQKKQQERIEQLETAVDDLEYLIESEFYFGGEE